jgi:UDP-N-acetylmuramoyl-L-alanyl-D-glutamate--2,6-diaminopimelate ligase
VPGALFVAVPGVKGDGAAYIPQALAKGAVAIVGEGPRSPALKPDIYYHQTKDSRRFLSLAAARFYPHQPDNIAAVTGTSGKSSVVDFVRQFLALQNIKAASLGTIGIVTPQGALYGNLTTPGPIALHETLDQLTHQGITHLAMEASSHGIDQRRLDGVRLKAVAFTNLGRDHLDYHATHKAYQGAKLRLFETLAPSDAVAVINQDGEGAQAFIKAAQKRGLTLATTGTKGSFLQLISAHPQGFSQHLTLLHQGRKYDTHLPLIGRFQVENALVAAALALVMGAAPDKIIASFPQLQGVKGRLERVAEINGALCIVDYAHKPEALAHVLDAVRPFVTGKLICVFGCGGDRDQGKRPLMGAIAAKKADCVIITDDNPRSEDPAAIRAAIRAGVPETHLPQIREIASRSEAIATAISELQQGDVLIVAGKGHETGQITQGETLPFSDHEEILKTCPKPEAY